jgi:hypothetical protein
MKRKWFFYFNTETGLSLVEILAAITILFLLSLSFIPMFVQSARTNTSSQKMMDATYLAESSMETIESLVTSSTAIDSTFTSSMGSNGYTQTLAGCSAGTCYEKNSNGHYLFVQLTNAGIGSQLVNAKIKVYADNTKANQQAQMENLLSLKK